MDLLKERLDCSFGENQKRQWNAVRESLWLSAARCAAAGEDDEHAADVAACLRSVRLLTSCYLPRFPMRLLPESPGHLLIPVDVPMWNNAWQDALANPSAHLQTAEAAEMHLSAMLQDVACKHGKPRDVMV